MQNVTGTTGYMAPNWDEPTGATSPQAILFSGNFTIRPLCHERQLHHLATLPTGVTSPCISVEIGRNGDLGVTERERREGESDQIEEDPEVPKAPVYHPRVKIATKPQGHQYHLRSKGPAPIPAPRVSRVRSQGVKLDQSPVASELLECSRL